MDPELPQTSTAARRAQAGAEQEQRLISHGGVDPDYISRLEHFGALTHEEIFRCVQEMEPGAMHGYSDTWVSIANCLSGAVVGLHVVVQSVLAEGLRGRIAAAADSAARQFVQQATDIEEVIRGSGHRIMAAAYGAEAVKRSVPPPPIAESGSVHDSTAAFLSALTGAPAPSDAHEFAAFKEEQYRIALAALDANYVTTYPPAGSGVPSFTPTSLPGVNGGGAALLGSTNFGGSPASVGVARTPIGSADPTEGSTAMPSTSSDSTTPTATASEETSSQRPDSSNTSSSDWQDSSDSEASDASPSTTPANLGPAPSSPVSPGGGGTPPLGSPHTPSAPGGLPTTPGDPGRSIAGGPNSQTTSTPTLSGAPGHSRQNWIPGMYPPAAARGTDTESTRTTPDWLIWNREHELIGTTPPYPPATIGAEIPAAQQDHPTGSADDRS